MSTAIDDAPFTPFHRRLTVACSGGPLLDGYILSIIGTALPGMSRQLHLSGADTQWIAAAALVGMFIGGVLFGVLTDRIGREVMYTLDLTVMAVCSVLSFWAGSAWLIVALRLVLGVAVAADYPIATSLLAEWLPRKQRGRLLGFQIVAWYAGAVLAYLVGELALVVGGDNSWRWQLAGAVVPCVFFVVLRRSTAPESPRWLAQHGKPDRAVALVQKFLGLRIDPRELILPQSDAPRATIRELFGAQYLRRTVFCSGFFLCQVTVLFAMLTFGPQILVAMGMHAGERMATLGTAFIALVFLLGCLPAMHLLERIGRRRTIVWCFGIMIVPTLLIGVWPSMPAVLGFVVLCIYAFASGGPNVLDWTYPNELFGTRIRATAVGFATSISRIGAAVGTYLLPWLLDHQGMGRTMLYGTVLTAAGFLICVWGAPETKGQSLDPDSAAPTESEVVGAG